MDEQNAEICYTIVLPVRGPIEPTLYIVDGKQIRVSYPSEIQIDSSWTIQLPTTSTRFDVTWRDRKNRTRARLESNSFERYLPLQDALYAANKLIEAFKLVRVGHADGLRLRSVGKGDTLFYTVTVNGAGIGIVNLALNLSGNFDPHGTTELAKCHVAGDSFVLGRRYLRSFDLADHGYHSEAVIIAHSILDDTVQTMIENLLASKGLVDSDARDLIVRGIKERRLKTYLGPLLKILVGKSISDMWADADACLDWLNKVRNGIAHRGGVCTYSDAAWAIFASMRIVSVLAHNNAVLAEFPQGMMRHARIEASWTISPPSWVPTSDQVEIDEFDPHSAA
ncbi:hypothetical protein [Rhizobium sp. No.120]